MCLINRKPQKCIGFNPLSEDGEKYGKKTSAKPEEIKFDTTFKTWG